MTRFHRKSRAGCTQCKRRRVKCDERKPSCANCGRNGMQCSLEFLTPRKICGYEAVGQPRRVQEVMGKRKYSFSQSLSRQLSDPAFEARTGELFHHYISVVAPSLDGNQTPSIWSFSMPQMAIAYPFLFCGITAVSAMHLATLVPRRARELQTLALVQENAALPSFRTSIDNPSLDSIHANFAFAGSVVYYIMASPEHYDASGKVDRCRLPSPGDKYPHWFQAMRGLMALFEKHRRQLESGPFGPMLSRDHVYDYVSNNPDTERLDKLDEMFSSSSGRMTPTVSGLVSCMLSPDAERDEICRRALHILRRVFELTHSTSQMLSSEAALRVWPGSVSPSFVELIYDKDPKALVILAHYCVVLKRNDHTWYVGDLGYGLLKNILQFLGTEWQHWIEWPLLEVFS